MIHKTEDSQKLIVNHDHLSRIVPHDAPVVRDNITSSKDVFSKLPYWVMHTYHYPRNKNASVHTIEEDTTFDNAQEADEYNENESQVPFVQFSTTQRESTWFTTAWLSRRSSIRKRLWRLLYKTTELSDVELEAQLSTVNEKTHALPTIVHQNYPNTLSFYFGSGIYHKSLAANWPSLLLGITILFVLVNSGLALFAMLRPNSINNF